MARLGMESGRERRQRRGHCMLRWSVKEIEEREKRQRRERRGNYMLGWSVKE